MAVGQSHALWSLIEELAFVVASYRRQTERHQPVGSLSRKQAARANIPEVDDMIYSPRRGIAKDGIERGNIPVNVRDGSNLHAAFYRTPLGHITPAPSQFGFSKGNVT